MTGVQTCALPISALADGIRAEFGEDMRVFDAVVFAGLFYLCHYLFCHIFVVVVEVEVCLYRETAAYIERVEAGEYMFEFAVEVDYFVQLVPVVCSVAYACVDEEVKHLEAYVFVGEQEWMFILTQRCLQDSIILSLRSIQTKQWFDDVLVYGWAYGSKGKALAGRKTGIAVSLGAPAADYQANGAVVLTIWSLTVETSVIFKLSFMA